MVKKANRKWHMCTDSDYADLNKACPKDAYPLPNIDKLMDGASDIQLLRFLDAYSRYNQIKKVSNLQGANELRKNIMDLITVMKIMVNAIKYPLF